MDIFLSYFFPIATDDDIKGRLEQSRIKVVLAVTGPLEKATVRDKIISSPALRLLGLHTVELAIGWVCVFAHSADAAHADVSLWICLIFGVAPVVVGLLTLYLVIFPLPKRGDPTEAIGDRYVVAGGGATGGPGLATVRGMTSQVHPEPAGDMLTAR